MMSKRTIVSAVTLVVAALTVCAGTATATTLTSPSGTPYTSTLKAESEGELTLHYPSVGISVSCEDSTLEGKIERHGNGVTAGGKLNNLTLTACGNNHVTILSMGSLEVHATSGGDGTVTSTGAAITKQSTEIGISCTFQTNGTHIGTLIGSSSTNARIVINSAVLPRTGDSFFCGSSGVLTGSLKITTPSTLLVD
jgi:hypothetical protein